MRIVFFGDVVGRPGRRAVAVVLRQLRREQAIDFVVANGENAAGGKGIDPGSAEELQDAGIDVITTGNHVWQNREIIPYLRENGRVLRPLNFTPGTPGAGWVVRDARDGTAVAVVNVIGRVFMGPADCPFRAVDAVLPEIRDAARVILVDMHAEATSEKVGMGRYLDGRVTAVIGSHTHVQTADEAILAGGTAVLSDAGMCGPEDSILGVRTDRVLERFVRQMPVRFEVASGPVVVHGAIVDVDASTGRATAIRRIRERVAP
jgi:metallophosphoesterase (TIGR00282 family)